MTRESHDPRCEDSATKANRCQCACGGNLHGINAPRQRDAEAINALLHATDEELTEAIRGVFAKMDGGR